MKLHPASDPTAILGEFHTEVPFENLLLGKYLETAQVRYEKGQQGDCGIVSKPQAPAEQTECKTQIHRVPGQGEDARNDQRARGVRSQRIHGRLRAAKLKDTCNSDHCAEYATRNGEQPAQRLQEAQLRQRTSRNPHQKRDRQGKRDRRKSGLKDGHGRESGDSSRTAQCAAARA